MSCASYQSVDVIVKDRIFVDGAKTHLENVFICRIYSPAIDRRREQPTITSIRSSGDVKGVILIGMNLFDVHLVDSHRLVQVLSPGPTAREHEDRDNALPFPRKDTS